MKRTIASIGLYNCMHGQWVPSMALSTPERHTFQWTYANWRKEFSKLYRQRINTEYWVPSRYHVNYWKSSIVSSYVIIVLLNHRTHLSEIRPYENLLPEWLFIQGFSSHSRIFLSFGDETITNLTYARHSWPLRSESSLACHTYCDTGRPFIMIISEDPWHLHLLPNVWQWSCHYLF